jgi:hypothetical protein
MNSRWISIATAAAFGSFAGAVIAGLLLYGAADPTAVLSSLATLAAAVAAFLTVREMQAGRKLSARARVGFGGSQDPVHFVWTPSIGRVLKIDGPATMILRNTTGGSADTVRATWRAATKITAEDIEAINRSASSIGVVVTVQPSSYEVRIRTKHETISIPISGLDQSVIGDIGPAQELELPVPVVVTNYAVLKWLALIASAGGSPVLPQDVPRFDLIISHGNAYEKSIEDHHEIRFPFSPVEQKGSHSSEEAKSAPAVLAERKIEGSVLPEVWSKELQNQTVVSV